MPFVTPGYELISACAPSGGTVTLPSKTDQKSLFGEPIDRISTHNLGILESCLASGKW